MRRILEGVLGVGLALVGTSGAAFAIQAAESTTPARARPGDVDERAADARAAMADEPAPIGDAFDKDEAMKTHADPVASYTLTAILDAAKHDVHGSGTITWKNASVVPESELYVHLYLNAFKNDRTYFERFVTGGFRGGGETKDFGHIEVKKLFVREMDRDVWKDADKTSPNDPDDETDIRVPLPRAVAPGETITLDVDFDEHLPEVTFRTGHFGSFHLVGQWFPKIAKLEPDGHFAHFEFHHLSEFYSDFGKYDVTLDTPDDYVVGATGALVSESKAEGRARRRYVQDDVHEFAWTAWDKFKEKTSTSSSGVALRVLYPEGFDKAADTELDTVRYGLDYFGKAFGKYPYKTLTVVHPPPGADEAGGMEYPTFITSGEPWFIDAMGIRLFENVTIHELGHQWFYGLVATNENAWPFLDEGMNSYAEADALGARYHESSFGTILGMPLSEEAIFRSEASQAESDWPVASSSPSFPSGGDYGALVYHRTATIFLTLGRVYGQDLVRKAVGRYTRRYRFEHPGPEQLVAAVREVVGDEAASTLHAALFDMATVDYEVSDVVPTEDEGAKGIFGDPANPKPAPKPEDGVFTGSALLRRRGALRFPVDVDFIGADGTKQRVVWQAKSHAERLHYKGKSKLVAVVVDPDHKILLDDDLLNNAKKTGPILLSPTVFDRALFLWETTLAGSGP